jgi:Meckel syndrome type 1 protein
MSDQPQTRTFRGRSLAELTDRIKAELGEDAVAVSVRQGRTKGLGGFFAQETVEVEAVAGPNAHGAVATSAPEVGAGREIDGPPARPAEPSFYERLREAGGVDALQQRFVAANDADSYDMLMPDGNELPAINDLDDEPDPEPTAARGVVPYETRFDVEARASSSASRIIRRPARPEPAPMPVVSTPEPIEVAPRSEPVAFVAPAPEPVAIEAPRPEPTPQPVAIEAPGPESAPAAIALVPDLEREPADVGTELTTMSSVALEAAAHVSVPEILPPGFTSGSALPEIALMPTVVELDDDEDLDGDELLPAVFVTPARNLPAMPESAAMARQVLIERGFAPELAQEAVDEVIHHLLPFAPRNASMRRLIATTVARQMTPLPRRGGNRSIVGFIGSGGSGKTRCAAQLALGYARRGAQSLCVVSLRPTDGGASLRQQLMGCDVEVHVARTGRGARAIIDAAEEASLIILDTPAVSPRMLTDLRRLRTDLQTIGLDECHLALPATVDYRHAAEVVRAARALGVDSIVITHADETQYLGTAVSVAILSELPVSYVGRIHGNQRGLRPALSESLALALVS